jgi:O-antigen/teichoic acid export membrane protein
VFSSTLSKNKIPVVISYINLILGLALGILATNFYGLEVVGLIYFSLGLQQLFGFLLTLGIGTYSIKYLARSKSKKSILRCLNLITRHIVVILFFCLLLLFIMRVFMPDMLNIILILSVTLVLVSLIRFLVEDILLGMGLMNVSVLQAFAESSLRLIFISIFFVESQQDILIILILSSFIPLLINCLIFFQKLKKFKLLKVNARYVRAYYSESLIIFSSHFLAMIHTRSGVVIAGWFFSPTLVGVYGLLINISEPILRLGTVISRFFMRAGATADNLEIIRLWRTVLLAAFLGALAALILSYFFLIIDDIFYNSSLIKFSLEFNILLIYSVAFLLVNITVNILNGIGLSLNVLKLSTVSTLLYLFLLSIASAKNSFILFVASISLSSTVLCLTLMYVLYNSAYVLANKKIYLGNK